MPMQISISNAIGGGGGSQGGGSTPTPPSFADTKSFQFDGVTDYVNTNTTIVGTTFSISAWFKVANTTDLQPIVSTRENSISSSRGIDIYIQSDILTFRIYRNGGTSVTQAFTDLGWNHVLYVYDGTTLEGFLNGISIGSAVGTYATSTQTLKTGIFIPSSEYAETYIDEVALFYTDESANALTIFNGGVPNDLTAFNPILWYRMGEEATWNGSKFVLDNQGSLGGTATSVGILPSDPNPTTDVPLFDNKSFIFDGNIDYINIGDNNNLSFGDGVTDSPFSISAWINMDTDTNFSICSKYSTSGKLEYQFVFASGGRLMFRLFDGGSTVRIGRLTADISSNVGSWTHVVATYDGSSTLSGIKIYVNNNRSDVTDSSLNTYIAMHNTSTPFLIGRYATSYADGKINDTSIFNSELTQANVSTIFNGGVPNDISALSPLSWWRAEQVTFDGTNWTLIDQGSGGNNGLSSSMPLTARTSDVPLFDNKSFTFDGIDDSVNVGLLSDLNGTQYFSMSMWVNPSALTSSTDHMIFSTYTTSTNKLFFEFFGNQFGVNITNGTSRVVLFPMTFLTGQWYHITLVYDGTQVGADKLKCYFDGVSQTNTQANFPSSLGTFINDCRIGSYDPYFAYYSFNGNIDEFAFFNTALSQANVTEIYNGGIANDISNLNPISYWRSEFANWDGSNWTLIDQGSGANNGTSVSMPLTSRTSDVPT